MKNRIFECQYSCGNPLVWVHTRVDECSCMLALKSRLQAKSFRKPRLRFQEPIYLTLWTSFREENENSWKAFPREINPYLHIDRTYNLKRKLSTFQRSLYPLAIWFVFKDHPWMSNRPNTSTPNGDGYFIISIHSICIHNSVSIK